MYVRITVVVWFVVVFCLEVTVVFCFYYLKRKGEM